MEAGLGVGPGAVDDQLAVGAQLGDILQPVDIGEQAVDIGGLVVVERHQHAFRPHIHLRHAGLFGVQLDLDDLNEVVGRIGQRAEAIDHLGGEGLDLGMLFEVVQAAVQSHAQVEVGDVIVRDQDRRIDRDLGAEVARTLERATGLGLQDRLLQHRLVEFVADFLDMPRLFVAQQIARAANVEIVAGKLEPGAQRVEVGQHLQPLLRGIGHLPLGRGDEIGIGARLGATDAPAKLVELRQAEAVGAVDDHRVGGRDVDPAFDDGGGNQHLELLVVKGRHALLHLGGGHLAVRDDVADLGHLVAQELLQIGQVGDAGGDKEALAAAIMLAQQGLAQHHRVPRHDIGAHRQAIDRRGLDDGQLAQTRHRHLQRARDRRRGQRQHVDVGLQRLQPFLVRHAEALFLVDHDEAEALELDILGQQRVRPDDDVEVARCGAFLHLLGLRGGDEARQPPDLDREAFEPLDEVVVMLAREQGRGTDHRDLHPRHRRDKGGAQRHLGLAEADIADDQPVHRLARGKVGQHILDRAVLIVGFLVGEAIDEAGIAGGIRLRQFAGA